MAKNAKTTKTAKNTRAKSKVKKLPDSGKKRFPRLRTVTQRAGD
jgi:hypothetical protein